MDSSLAARPRKSVGSPGREYGFDRKLHNSISKKRMSLSYLPPIDLNFEEEDESGPIFDQILFLGARPTSEYIKNATPEILLLYPSSPLLLSEIDYVNLSWFCFPKGFDVTEGKTDDIIQQFVFKFGGSNDQKTYYGVCTIFSLARRKQNGFFLNDSNKNYPVCLCILTSSPKLSAQFTYETYIAKWLCGSISGYRMRDVTPTETHDEDEPLLPGMVWVKGAQKMNCFLVPRAILSEFTYMKGIRPLDQTRRVPFTEKIALIIPPVNICKNSIQYASLDAIFSVLSVGNIIRCVTMALLEKQIVIVGSSEHITSMCVLCLREIIKPFNYKGTFLPIVPNASEFLGVLDSPVPFICGLVTLPVRKIPKNVAIVDIDKDEIIDNEGTASLPRHRKLEEKLNKILKQHSKEITIPSKTIRSGFAHRKTQANPAFPEFLRERLHFSCVVDSYFYTTKKYLFSISVCNEIIEVFRNHLAPKMEKLIQQCFVTDTTDIEHVVTVFNKELFLASTSNKSRDFYSEIVNTMMFQEFCDRKTTETELHVAQPYTQERVESLSILTPSGTDEDDELQVY